MTRIYRKLRGGMAASALALGAAGCDLDVTNPGLIDAATFDPTEDAATLAFSAQQIFFGAFQGVIQSGGLLSEAISVSDERPPGPVARFSDLLASEWIMLWSLRSIPWAFAGTVAVNVPDAETT